MSFTLAKLRQKYRGKGDLKEDRNEQLASN